MNTYLIKDKVTCLIDTSAEPIPTTLLNGFQQIGMQIKQLDYILITHIHYEHIRSLPYLKEQVPHCQILTSPWNAEYLAHFELNTKKAFQKCESELKSIPGLFEFYHTLFNSIPAIQVDGILTEGDGVSLGELSLEVIDTAGHCADEISFYCPQKHALFSGDFIIGEDLETWIATNPIISNYGGNRKVYINNLQKIASIQDKIKVIYPAHGPVIQDPPTKIQWLQSIKDRASQKVLALLQDAPKTLSELVVTYFHKPLESTQKFYNASRMMQALLHYLLENYLIMQNGDI